MQLIRITNMPIQYQYEIERARFEARKSDPLEAKMEHMPSDLKIRSKDIEVKLNTDAMRDSMGMHSNTDWAKKHGQRGLQKAQEATGETAEFGNQMARIDDGVTIGQIVRNKALEQPQSYMTFIPSVGPDISWDPAELNMSYDPGEVNIDWQMRKQAMDFIPGKFSLVITQYPKVSIEYLGGINYVPPSSDPDYEG